MESRPRATHDNGLMKAVAVWSGGLVVLVLGDVLRPLLGFVFSTLGSLVAILALASTLGRSSYPIRRPPREAVLLWVLGSFAGALGAVGLGALWIAVFSRPLFPNAGLHGLEVTPEIRLTFFVCTVFAYPLIEEVVFRVHLLGDLRRLLSSPVSICLSSLAFASWHAPTEGVVLVIAFGLWSGLLMEVARSLPLCVGMHMGFNLGWWLLGTTLPTRLGQDAWVFLPVFLMVSSTACAIAWRARRSVSLRVAEGL